MKLQDFERLLATLSVGEHSRLLSLFGHELTVLARDAYEIRGPGVTDPRLLRDINEIQHRVFGQIAALTRNGQPSFPPDALAAWIFGEHRPHLQSRLSCAFATALKRLQATA